jgi:hypothetical protein
MSEQDQSKPADPMTVFKTLVEAKYADSPQAEPEDFLKHMMNAVREMSALLPQPAGDRLRAILDFRHSITAETDRGAALMAAAFMDDKLKFLITAKLVDDKKLARRAFDFNGPLGTFSARIDFAHLMGVLPGNARRDLHVIRSIRNKFAHEAGPMDFEDERVKPLCETLVFHGVKPTASAGSKFRRSVMGLLALITIELEKVEHMDAMPDFKVPDRTEEYRAVSSLFEKVTGRPYPLKHEHENDESGGDVHK